MRCLPPFLVRACVRATVLTEGFSAKMSHWNQWLRWDYLLRYFYVLIVFFPNLVVHVNHSGLHFKSIKKCELQSAEWCMWRVWQFDAIRLFSRSSAHPKSQFNVYVWPWLCDITTSFEVNLGPTYKYVMWKHETSSAQIMMYSNIHCVWLRGIYWQKFNILLKIMFLLVCLQMTCFG